MVVGKASSGNVTSPRVACAVVSAPTNFNKMFPASVSPEISTACDVAISLLASSAPETDTPVFEQPLQFTQCGLLNSLVQLRRGGPDHVDTAHITRLVSVRKREREKKK